MVIFLASGRSKRVRNSFIFKYINGLIDFDFKLITSNNIHILITQEQAKTYIYLEPTQTGENENQSTKPQMTSTTSITRLKTPILYQNSRLF